MPPVLADFATRFGRVRDGTMAVVALGKAGSREMMAGSDLDLMLVYAHEPDLKRLHDDTAGFIRSASGEQK